MLMKKLFRTMGIYKAQFISMIIMLTLGVGIFVGFNVEWYSIDEDTLSITVTENESVSGFVLAEGEPYDASDDEGMWIGEKYAVENNIELGDTISLTYNSIEVEGVVKGFVQSSEYMICVQDATQLMPDYTKYGYAYISPQMLESISYAGSQGEVEEGQIMGSILPVIFLVIAVLTMVTTMVRITDKERTQASRIRKLIQVINE